MKTLKTNLAFLKKNMPKNMTLHIRDIEWERETHTHIDREREFCVKENESDTESGNRKMLKRMIIKRVCEEGRVCYKEREGVCEKEKGRIFET